MTSVSSGGVQEISADGDALAPELHLAIGVVLGVEKSVGKSSEVEMHFTKVLWLSGIRNRLLSLNNSITNNQIPVVHSW